jgi:glucose-6-phosphate 1-dehydrogenase
MEPPIADHADAYRDEELKILRQIEPLDPAHTVRGQYVGYLESSRTSILGFLQWSQHRWNEGVGGEVLKSHGG